MEERGNYRKQDAPKPKSVENFDRDVWIQIHVARSFNFHR